MARAGKWLTSFCTRKKVREKERKDDEDGGDGLATDQEKSGLVSAPPPPPQKEKRRWSFRRSTGRGVEPNSAEPKGKGPARAPSGSTAVPAAAAIRVAEVAPPGSSAADAAAATKIQSFFRAYLARKALRALKGLVKLQALVRGHLVRKQAAATLRCIQALLTAQARALAQRTAMAVGESPASTLQRQSTHGRPPPPADPRRRQSYEMERDPEEDDGDVKIVEMDPGEPRSPRARGGHLAGFSAAASALPELDPAEAASAPPAQGCAPFPNYMANTESSRAKQRPERQPSRRRPSTEGRTIPRAAGTQRVPSSPACPAAHRRRCRPRSNKLDCRSSMSVMGSECGSAITVLTDTSYCRFLVGRHGTLDAELQGDDDLAVFM